MNTVAKPVSVGNFRQEAAICCYDDCLLPEIITLKLSLIIKIMII